MDTNLGCTNNRVELAALTVAGDPNDPPNCIAGQPVTVDLQLQMRSTTSQANDDVAVFVAQDGGDISEPGGAQSCAWKNVSPNLTAAGNNSLFVTSDDNPSLDGDVCVDTLTGISGVDFFDTFNGVQVFCDPTTGGGQVDAVVGWNTNGQNDCDGGVQDLGTFQNGAQCSLNEDVFVDLDVIGTLTVVKQTTPSLSNPFDFDSSDGYIPGGLINDQGVEEGTFQLAGNGGSIQMEAFLDDTPIVVTETPLNPAFALDSIVCTIDGTNNTPANVTIDLNNARVTVPLTGSQPYVTCVFTNRLLLGTIRINKTSDGGDDTFHYTSSPALGSLGTAFDIDTIGETGTTGDVINLPVGTYTVTETDPSSDPGGWDFTSLVCVDPDQGSSTNGRVATIDLDDGETVTCTYTNTKRGSITIIKQITSTDPENKTFSFTGTGPNNFDFGGGFTLTPTGIGLGGADSTFPDYTGLVPGAYTVTETDPTGDGWQLVGVLCSGESYSDPVTNPATITLDPGENVVCTFTNAPIGTTTIVKNSIGGEGQFGYTWGTQGNNNIPPNESANFNLDTADGDPPTTGTASRGFILTPDTDYDLAESSLPASVDPYARSWSLTDLDCGDAGNLVQIPGANGSDVTITGSDSSNVTCTFTNTLEGALVIRKETVPDGADLAFSFTGTDAALTGDIRDYSSFTEELVLTAQPGTFGVTETVPQGWSLSNISCTGATNSTISIGTGGDFASPGFDQGDDEIEVDLAAGEVVTCTFENTESERLAEFLVYKKFMDGNDITPVTLKIQCNGGKYSPSEVTMVPPEINGPEDYVVNFIISKFTDGMDCTVWEEPIAGYTPSYECDVFSDEGVITQCSDGDDSPLDEYGVGPCVFTDVETTGISPIRHSCMIRNYPDPVDIDVTKVWETFGAQQADVDPDVRITLFCEDAIEIVGGTFVGGLWTGSEWLRESDGDFDDEDDNYVGIGTATFKVVPEFIAPETDPDKEQQYETECWATENIDNDAVEIVSDCGTAQAPGLGVRVGEGDECTITNTVFFEGIPTLSQFGTAILVLLMLGIGFLGLRRAI